MDTKKTSGGQEGNNNAQGFQLTRMLEAKLNESNASAKRKIVQNVIDAAEANERWAIEFVWDRSEGKPANINKTTIEGKARFEVEIVGVN